MNFFPGKYPGEHQRKGEGDDGHQHDEQNGVLKRLDELSVAKQNFKVVQPYEGLRVGIAAPFEERHPEHVEGRYDHKDKEQNQSRRDTGNDKALAPLVIVQSLPLPSVEK